MYLITHHRFAIVNERIWITKVDFAFINRYNNFSCVNTSCFKFEIPATDKITFHIRKRFCNETEIYGYDFVSDKCKVEIAKEYDIKVDGDVKYQILKS